MSVREYLAVYDYGTGGLWALIAAPSINEIKRRFPELIVYETRPSWMTDEQYNEMIGQISRFDLNGPFPEWIRLMIAERPQTA